MIITAPLCLCGHSPGVHAFCNQLGSCARPGCACMKYQVDQRSITVSSHVEIKITAGKKE